MRLCLGVTLFICPIYHDRKLKMKNPFHIASLEFVENLAAIQKHNADKHKAITRYWNPLSLL